MEYTGVINEFSRRSNILKHWLLGRNNGVSLIELIQVLFTFPSIKSRHKIKKVEESEKYLIIYFHDFKNPFYYPKNVNIRYLYLIMGESFDPNHWHYYEIEETRVNHKDVVIDCGAAEGMFSFLIAERCKKVYAIEPLPQFIEAMKLTFGNFSNIDILPFALSDKEGSGILSENDISSKLCCSNNGVQVKITTIDRLFYDKNIPVSYIKADIEGYEMEMLKGARNTIKKYHPKIAITTYHNSEHAERITNFLKNINMDYKIKLKGIESRAGMPVMLHAWMDME